MKGEKVMKKAAFIALFSIVAAIGVLSAAPKSVHAMTISGTVSAVNQKAKTFSLKDDKGKETAITWTAATRVIGGTLKDGDRVNVSVFPKDGKNVATSIRIASANAMAKAS
jgi:exonuclease VII large subunit